jgi:hypothetical protein
MNGHTCFSIAAALLLYPAGAGAGNFESLRREVRDLGRLTAETTAWFVNLRAGPLTASSDYMEE